MMIFGTTFFKVFYRFWGPSWAPFCLQNRSQGGGRVVHHPSSFEFLFLSPPRGTPGTRFEWFWTLPGSILSWILMIFDPLSVHFSTPFRVVFFVLFSFSFSYIFVFYFVLSFSVSFSFSFSFSFFFTFSFTFSFSFSFSSWMANCLDLLAG